MFEGSFQCIYKVCLVKIARPNLSQNFMNMEKTIDLTRLYIQINNTVGFFSQSYTHQSYEEIQNKKHVKFHRNFLILI